MDITRTQAIVIRPWPGIAVCIYIYTLCDKPCTISADYHFLFRTSTTFFEWQDWWELIPKHYWLVKRCSFLHWRFFVCIALKDLTQKPRSVDKPIFFCCFDLYFTHVPLPKNLWRRIPVDHHLGYHEYQHFPHLEKHRESLGSLW